MRTSFTARWMGKSTRRQGAQPIRPQFDTLEDRCVPATFADPGFGEYVAATGIPRPTSMALIPDGSGRVLITEQGTTVGAQVLGRVRVFDPAIGLLPTPFLTVPVNYPAGSERGLQSVVLDPDYLNNGYVYVYYTTPTPAPHFNRITRWTTDPNNRNVALANSERIIMRLDQLSGATNHNGGGMVFGFDGLLYITTGENANTSLAQNLNSVLGKVLRINPYVDEFPGDPNRNYGIPADNPFVGTPGARGEIYARGFRNPFTAAIHPYYGYVFINDVGGAGASRREEINYLADVPPYGPGGNFGWPLVEGIVGNPSYIDPTFAYAPGYGGTNCSVVGGDFYAYYWPEFGGFPAQYQDDYFFADYCGRWIHRFDINTGQVNVFATNTQQFPVDVLVDYGYGWMYYLTRGSGAATGELNLVYFAGAGPGSAPGGTGGDKFVVDGVVIGGLETAASTPAQVAAQSLAELPRVAALDQTFASLVSDEQPAVTPLQQAEAEVVAELWEAIF